LLLLFNFVDLDGKGVQFGEDAGHDVAIIGGGYFLGRRHVVVVVGGGRGLGAIPILSYIVVGSRCYEEEQ
jgi:hypothetical protein